MAEVDYVELQRQYGGLYIARRDGEVMASASSYDELMDRVERTRAKWVELVIEFIEPVDVVGVY